MFRFSNRRALCLWAATLFVLSLVAAAPTASAQQPGAPTDFFVLLKSQADLRQAPTFGTHAERVEFVYETKKAEAERSQAGLTRFLSERGHSVTSYWIANAVKVTGDRNLMAELSRRDDVAKIVPDRSYRVVEPVRKAAAGGPQAVEWNIDRIRAPEVWNTYGTRGEGIVVGTIDTGAEFTHPAIAGQYRGATPDGVNHEYNWFDPSQVCGAPSVVPCDNVDHGTHVLGTIVGDDGQGNQIGAAPGAKWIAAKGCETGNCSTEALLASGEWLMVPKDFNGNNPRPDLAPHVINNSWGAFPGDNPFYQAMVQAWVAAGIFPVFAAGNEGFVGCGSLRSPGDYPESYAVGAFDINNTIADFSARGPSPFGGETKPEVAAPGVNVRSSIPGGGYASFDGTSMAAPHVTGTVALVWSAAPSLTGAITATRDLLDDSAIDTEDLSCGGIPEDNNVWGHGRLDAFEAVTQAPRGPSGALTGTVTSGTEPLAGARIDVSGPNTRTTTTDAAGQYQVSHLAVGDYEVTASAFGFLSQTAQVTIAENGTATRDFYLAVAPRHTVSGHVRDGAGAAVSGVEVSFPGTPLPTVSTDDTGAYQIADVPEGTFDMLADISAGCLLPQRKQVTVGGDTTVDFTLPAKSDGFGHVCEETPSSWVDANTVLPLSGLDVTMPLDLPFPVEFYGTLHTSITVTSKAYISFTDPSLVFFNSQIPNPDVPNGAIYALWDDLWVDENASVRTELIGTAPNRQFVIEWRDVRFFGEDPAMRVSVELLLAENGRITMQYKGIGDHPRERGNSATVGIENQAGTDALQYSFEEPVLSDDTAITFRVPGTGLVGGRITDANDDSPVAGATVTITQDGVPDLVVTADGNGNYGTRVRVGDFHLRVEQPGYVTHEADLTLAAEDGRVEHDVVLLSGRVEVTPTFLETTIPVGEQRSRPMTVANTGTAGLSFQVTESISGPPEVVDVPWLRVDPVGGTLAPGTSSQLTVTLDAAQAGPGAHLALVVVTADSGRNPVAVLVVRLIVTDYQVGINAGGDAHVDASGDTWVVDRKHTPGGFGFLDNNRSKTVRTNRPIAGTTEQPLYRNLREKAFEYRFDNVPNGVYAIDLKFAELRDIQPNTRVFDVIAEGSLLIPALDIANDAGSFIALDRPVFVFVNDGQLNLRLVSRRGDPIINALRVTHRPDL